MPYICVSKLTITGSDNGLWPGWHQAIIWTNDGIMLIWTLGINFNEILSEIYTFSFKKMLLKMFFWKMATILSLVLGFQRFIRQIQCSWIPYQNQAVTPKWCWFITEETFRKVSRTSQNCKWFIKVQVKILVLNCYKVNIRPWWAWWVIEKKITLKNSIVVTCPVLKTDFMIHRFIWHG